MKAHYDAVDARLNAEPKLSGKGHDSALVDADGLPVRATYWILFGGAPEELNDGRLASPQSPDSDATYVYTVRCVSVTAAGVRATMTLVLAQLVGFTPTIAGRNCSPLHLTDSDDVQPDNSIKLPLFYADLVFELVSSRA